MSRDPRTRFFRHFLANQNSRFGQDDMHKDPVSAKVLNCDRARDMRRKQNR